MESVKFQLGMSSGFFVESSGRSGGLALLWSQDVNVTIQSFSRGHIDARVEIPGKPPWRVTGFYGHPVKEERRHSWNLLRRLAPLLDLPWLVLGDFNEILYQHEKLGMADRSYSAMAAFRDALLDCDLFDLGFQGPEFTWWNGRDVGTVRERIDRAVGNNGWMHMFPAHRVFHISSWTSDHLPLLVTDGDNHEHKQVRWGHIPRFDPFWFKDPEFEELFTESWQKAPLLVDEQDLEGHILDLRDSLKLWSKQKHGSLRQKRRDLEKALSELRLYHHFSATEEKRMTRELEHVSSLEEEYWRQRGRSDWLRLMDKNTNYFHHKASSRRTRNEIKLLLKPSGESVVQQADLEDVAASYFEEIFTTASPAVNYLDGLNFSELTALQQSRLAAPYTYDKLQRALNQLPGKKAPGPDGMHVIFLKYLWHVVGSDVARIVLACLNEGSDFSHLNRTLITLIPKCKTPRTMSEFRPISLCNSIYKLMARMILNRLKLVIGSLISPQQSAFVSGRLITDNSIAAFECFHSMNLGLSGCDRHVAVKLDMAKAFDRVEWGYLMAVMSAMKFPNSFCQLIYRCISTVSYQITVNGHPSRTVTPSRGIRQGDPLSPFLFILCAEGLTAMINKANQEGSLRGLLFGRQGPELSHLLFADDSLLFMEAAPDGSSQLMTILTHYEAASGQKVNLHKSSLFFSRGVSDMCREELIAELGIPAGNGKGQYLGLPFMTGRSKKEIFSFVRERVSKKLSGWKETYLSPAGKEVLIKSVLQAIPTYVMQCFLLPKAVIHELEVLIRKFFWGATDGASKIHWKSWATCCLSKQFGGLGFRDLGSFNRALLAKQAWRLLRSPNSLSASILQAKYHQETTILNARVGSRPSFLWRSILEGRDLLVKGVRWRIGDGRSVRVYADPWVPIEPEFHPILSERSLEEGAVVRSLIDVENGCWNESLIQSTFFEFEASKILSIELTGLDFPDIPTWHYHNKGVYTVKSGYHLAMKGAVASSVPAGPSSMPSLKESVWRIIWHSKLQPRVQHFLWKLGHDCLPVATNLHRRGLGDQVCMLCGSEREDSHHCFLTCSIPTAVSTKSHFFHRCIRSGRPLNFCELLMHVFEKEGANGFGLFANILWQIWKSRCTAIFDGGGVYVAGLLAAAEQQYSDYLDATAAFTPVLVKPRWSDAWTKPPHGFVKVNVDASKTPVCSAIGFLIRDNTGDILHAETRRISLRMDVEGLELYALNEGLQAARGYSHVILEGDSLLAYQRLTSSEEDLSSLAPLAAAIKSLFLCFDVIQLSFVRRTGNCPAHELARLGSLVAAPTVWGDDLPDDVFGAVLADIS